MVSAISRKSSALSNGSSGWRWAAFRRATLIVCDVGNGNGPFSRAVGKWMGGMSVAFMALAVVSVAKLLDRTGAPQFRLSKRLQFPLPNFRRSIRKQQMV